jgi:hypothetical protein
MSIFLMLGFSTHALSSVIRHCMVAKGNGINWASTLGWMSESLAIKAKESRSMELEQGAPVKIDLNCFAGASSGAAAAILYQGLLLNPNLKVSLYDEGLRSPDDLDRLSKALRFLAVATDFSTSERTFIVSKALKFFLGLGPQDRENRGWWDRYALQEDEVLSLLGKYAVVARFLKESDFRESLPLRLPERLRPFALKHGLRVLTDLPERSPTSLPLSRDEHVMFREIFRVQGQRINDLADTIYRENGGDDYLWKSFYQEPLMDGFCMGSMIEFNHGGVLSRKLPSYESIRTLYMCSQKTISTIRESPNYQSYRRQNSFGKRAIFAEPLNLRAALRTSIREYKLFSAQLETLERAQLSYLSDESQNTYQSPENGLSNARLGNVGGWVPENVMAIPLVWYAFGLDQSAVKLSSLAIFGFLGDGSVGQFSDVWFLRSILGGTPKDTPLGKESPMVRRWLEDYKAYQNVIDELKPRLGDFSKRLQIRTTKADWNLPFLVPSFTGRGLKHLGQAINQTREWEG